VGKKKRNKKNWTGDITGWSKISGETVSEGVVTRRNAPSKVLSNLQKRTGEGKILGKASAGVRKNKGRVMNRE